MSIEVKCLLKTESNTGEQIATFWMRYPRIPCHEQFMTYRNKSSVSKSNRYRDLTDMQSPEYVPDFETATQLNCWMTSFELARQNALQLKRCGVLKEDYNRILEPYSLIETVATITQQSLANMFRFRIEKKGVQPITKKLFIAIREEFGNKKPIHSNEHSLIKTINVDVPSFHTEAMLNAGLVASVCRLDFMQKYLMRFDIQRELLDRGVRCLESEHHAVFEHFQLFKNNNWVSYRNYANLDHD